MSVLTVALILPLTPEVPVLVDGTLPSVGPHFINTHSMLNLSNINLVILNKAFVSAKWRVEYDALLRNNTWNLVPLPPSRQEIGCKWIFKIKHNPNGTMARCSWVPRCDFRETFSLVVKPTIIRTILFVSVTKCWQLRQVDVNNALLNGDLTEAVYLQQPLGYAFLVSIDFELSKSDASLFVHITNMLHIYLLVYVDEIIITDY
ncbi:Retrovirus-related Pol polyprotein from transposon TNT 1-94 [Gossypium australe]|uniref:Retrovirus-related Pol polyprotein from transposon TNT 1-94 n=1 Tax=Gossypium australe TaxID=47621 RepID=A0A5B6UFH2_9ROSI|nr:Retrovirus-related Pol polyprotein from transposon TNT 1-94 [Gossypium australe]